ncbi:hypothetical protein [Nonomuraea sp. NPDC002799]
MSTITSLKITIARAQLIDGLRALADFLDGEPGVPVNFGATVSYSVTPTDVADDGNIDQAERVEVDRVAALLGVTPEYSGGGSYYSAVRAFGPVEYRATAITQEHMAKVHAENTYHGVVTP